MIFYMAFYIKAVIIISSAHELLRYVHLVPIYLVIPINNSSLSCSSKTWYKPNKCPCCELKTHHTQELHIQNLICDKSGKIFLDEILLKQHVNFSSHITIWKIKEKRYTVVTIAIWHLLQTKLKCHVESVHEKNQ